MSCCNTAGRLGSEFLPALCIRTAVVSSVARSDPAHQQCGSLDFLLFQSSIENFIFNQNDIQDNNKSTILKHRTTLFPLTTKI